MEYPYETEPSSAETKSDPPSVSQTDYEYSPEAGAPEVLEFTWYFPGQVTRPLPDVHSA